MGVRRGCRSWWRWLAPCSWLTNSGRSDCAAPLVVIGEAIRPWVRDRMNLRKMNLSLAAGAIDPTWVGLQADEQLNSFGIFCRTLHGNRQVLHAKACADGCPCASRHWGVVRASFASGLGGPPWRRRAAPLSNPTLQGIASMTKRPTRTRRLSFEQETSNLVRGMLMVCGQTSIDFAPEPPPNKLLDALRHSSPQQLQGLLLELVTVLRLSAGSRSK